MMVKFLHTSDWQLGMTRHYLARRRGGDDDPQARFTSDRIDAVRRIGDLARAQGCAFVVVAGDVFETQNVSRQVITRTCRAMASIALPVYLLPGNHDSLEPGCIWDRPDFTQACPDNVTVLRDSTPIDAADGVQVIGVPLLSRHPSSDPVGPVVAGLTDDGTTRVLVAHGQLPGLSGQDVEGVLIDRPALDAAIARGAISYVALGDRHIRWPESPDAPIRYSGTQETTRFSDPGKGSVDVIEIADGRVSATPFPVGIWLHARVSRPMSTDEDIDALASELAGFDDPTHTIIRYDLHGGLTVTQNARLEALLQDQSDSFASLEPSEDRNDLTVLPDDDDLAGMDLPGWAGGAAQELADLAGPGRHDGDVAPATAVDALGLLRRLAARSEAGR